MMHGIFRVSAKSFTMERLLLSSVRVGTKLHIKTCVKSRLCYDKNLRKINIRNPMGMKLLLRVKPIITSIQEAILFQYGRHYKQQNLATVSIARKTIP